MPPKHGRFRSNCFQALIAVLVVTVLILGFTVAHASAQDDYKDGVAHFRKGDYHSAIASFKAAENTGMESAALYYNLGSAYFKIGKYAESRRYFTRVLDYPD